MEPSVRAALHQMALLAGFDGGLVDAVELDQLAVVWADLLFDAPVPEVGREAKGAVLLLV